VGEGLRVRAAIGGYENRIYYEIDVTYWTRKLDLDPNYFAVAAISLSFGR
jgi:hypothetical protein